MLTPSTSSTCPHLGLKDDPASFLAYPSTGNFCFHGKAPAVPLLEHQGNYCLCPEHLNCPVFIKAKGTYFPKELRITERVSESKVNDNRKYFIAVILVLLLASIIWGVIALSGNNLLNLGLFKNLSPVSPTFEAKTITVNPIPTPTLLFILPTQTSLPTPIPSPTSTSTPPQKHSLETPIQVDNYRYIVHLSMDGEGFDYLVKTYDTNIDVIKAINFMLPPAVWVNFPIVLSPGLKVIDPNMPAFLAYKVEDIEISTEQLAKNLKVNRELLQKYNGCPIGCNLKKNDWVIVPYLK